MQAALLVGGGAASEGTVPTGGLCTQRAAKTAPKASPDDFSCPHCDQVFGSVQGMRDHVKFPEGYSEWNNC